MEEVENHLKGFVMGVDNQLDRFLIKGEVFQATQLSSSLLKTINEKTDCGQGLSIGVKTLVCDETRHIT